MNRGIGEESELCQLRHLVVFYGGGVGTYLLVAALLDRFTPGLRAILSSIGFVFGNLVGTLVNALISVLTSHLRPNHSL